MATGTFKAYGQLPKALWNKEIDFGGDTIKAMLTPSTHTPNQDVHDYFDDISAAEVSGTGYTTGGITLTGKTEGYSSGTNTWKLVCDDITWTTVTITDVRNIHFVDTTPGTASTNPLIVYAVIDATLTPNAGNLTFDLDGTNGFLSNIAS